ncbi:MAG: NAD(P)/FAD-dependent oxidoreductase [Pseudomonadota bacterium]
MQDVVVIGGSFAGWTAALQLGRASRDVLVVDAGSPRNRTSPAAHGVPGWDGTPPADILLRFRNDATTYPTVSHVDGRVTGVRGAQDRFEVQLGTGATVGARRVLLAHGVRDTLPDLPGVAEAWGTSVLHCPYCHGYEVRGAPLAVLANHPMSTHQACLLQADWSAEVTLLTGLDGAPAVEDLKGTCIAIEPRRIAQLIPEAEGIGVAFAGGQTAQFRAMFVAPRVDLDGTPADMLGCACAEGPLGPYVQVGPMGQTTVPGVFAAGDCARPAHNVTSAIGDGATAGIGCHQSLVFPEMIQALERAA